MKKFLIVLLTAILSLSAFGFVGCTPTTSEETPVDTNVVTMNDFEHFDSQVQNIRVFDGMCISAHNTDKQYVKGGERSIEIKPVGLTWVKRFPYFVVPTYSIKYEYGYGDFTNVEKLTCWVYNASEETQWMAVGLTGMTRTHQYAEAAIKTTGEYYDLAHGWNFIEYYVYPEYVVLQEDFDITETYGVFFKFDRSAEITVASANTFYLDEIKLHYVEGEREQRTSFNLKADAEKGVWEVCDFEDTMQTWHFYAPYVVPSGIFGMPTMRVVNASAYNVTAKSGTNVLAVYKRAGVNNYATTYMAMDCSGMAEAFATIGQDLYDHPENYVLKMDLYNPNGIDHGFSIEFNADRSYDSSLTSDNSVASSYFSSNTIIPAQSWYTYEKNLSAIDANIKNRNSEKTAVSFVQHPDYIRFQWAAHRTSTDIEDRIVLIDNVRIEKVA